MKPAIFFAGRWYRCIGFAPVLGLQVGVEFDAETGQPLCIRSWDRKDTHTTAVVHGSEPLAKIGETPVLRMFANLILS